MRRSASSKRRRSRLSTRADAGLGSKSATDSVASPLTPAGAWLYGALIGVLTLLIRLFGGLPEGVMYAILLGNAVAPLIDRWVQPRVFGSRRSAAGGRA